MSDKTPQFPVRVFGLDKEDFKAVFIDNAVQPDKKNFRPILESGLALLASGQKYLSWSGNSFTRGALRDRMQTDLATFIERLKQAGLWEVVSFVTSDADGDKFIAAQALYYLARALQRRGQLVPTGKIEFISSGQTADGVELVDLGIPVEVFQGIDEDDWFRRLTEVIELVKLAVPEQTTPEPRFKIDMETHTATLDGTTYKDIDPNALQALLVYQNAVGTILPAEKVRSQLTNCHHDETLRRWLEKLPPELRNLIKYKPGSGRFFELPPLQ